MQMDKGGEREDGRPFVSDPSSIGEWTNPPPPQAELKSRDHPPGRCPGTFYFHTGVQKRKRLLTVLGMEIRNKLLVAVRNLSWKKKTKAE